MLSGGEGTTLRPLTFTRATQLIPVASKPIFGYLIDQVVAISIKKVGVITAPETGQYVNARPISWKEAHGYLVEKGHLIKLQCVLFS